MLFTPECELKENSGLFFCCKGGNRVYTLISLFPVFVGILMILYNVYNHELIPDVAKNGLVIDKETNLTIGHF